MSQRDENATASPQSVPGEESGQLYVYRVNSSVAYLGTRREDELGVAIGIGQIADGMYQCFAENINETAVITITVDVTGEIGGLLCHYLPF